MSGHHPSLGMMRLRRRAAAGEDDEVEILAFDERRDGLDVIVQTVIQIVTADDSYRTHRTLPSCGMYAKERDSLKTGSNGFWLRLHRSNQYRRNDRACFDGGDAGVDDHQSVGLDHRGRHSRSLRSHRQRHQLAVSRDYADAHV